MICTIFKIGIVGTNNVLEVDSTAPYKVRSAVDTNTGILSHNLYAYCNNNPVNMTDDSGQCSFWNGFVDFFVEQWNTIKAVVQKPINSYVGYVTNAWNWFPAAKIVRDEVKTVASAWKDVSTGNIDSLSYGLGQRTGMAVEVAVAGGVAKGIGMTANKIIDVGNIKGVRASGAPGIRYNSKSGQIKSIEIHPAHNDHGIHLQSNTWWYNKSGNIGNPYRAYANWRFEIFRPSTWGEK